jgi:hypothetical protein
VTDLSGLEMLVALVTLDLRRTAPCNSELLLRRCERLSALSADWNCHVPMDVLASWRDAPGSATST